MTIPQSWKNFQVAVQDDGVAVLTLDRPPANALSVETYRELLEFADFVSASDAVRAVVLAARAEARVWCAGGDVKEFVDLTYETRAARYALMTKVLSRIHEIDRPVIAAVTGNAAGAGLALAMLCDIRVGAEEALVAMPEIDRGLLANPTLLRRLGVPEAVVREMLMTGSRFALADLRGSGLFNYTLPRNQVQDKAMDCARLLAKKPLAALKMCKRLLNESEPIPRWSSTAEAIWKINGRLTDNGTIRARAEAFLERKPPDPGS